MRLLFLTNFYPPLEMGGWEQLCQEIVDALLARGHDAIVLTSRFRVAHLSRVEPHVQRKLFLESDPYYYKPLSIVPHLLRRDVSNLNYLRKMVTEHKPDVVSVWGMWLLNPQLAVLAEDLCPGRVAYYMAGYWPANDFEGDPHSAYWTLPSSHWWGWLVKRPVAWAVTRTLQKRRARAPQFEHVACVSRFVLEELRRRGLALPGGRVIYNGIDPQPFLDAAAARVSHDGNLRLVYVGGLVAHKGVHTAIEALGLLKQAGQGDGLCLTIVGGGHPDYEAQLRRRVQELDLHPYVTFRGRVPREQIAGILADQDVFLFTSVYEEPIARTVMEAMAAGLTVVGTAVGGQREMLKEGINALVYSPDDAPALAVCIHRLHQDPGLRAQLAAAGQRMVLEHFALETMVDNVEAWLKEIGQ